MRSADAIKTEIAKLEQMARVRRGKAGFSENVSDIEARLAACRTELEGANAGN